MNWPLFVSTFSLIFFAELPDKTAFATLILATRGQPVATFLGAAIAFVVQTMVAVVFGKVIGLFPEKWVQLGAGLLFLAFAIFCWFHPQSQEEEIEEELGPALTGRMQFLKAAWASFLVIFIAEWGDLTQLATASMAARYHHSLLTIFSSALLALWAVALIAILMGHKMKDMINEKLLHYLSVGIFTLVGFYFIGTWALA